MIGLIVIGVAIAPSRDDLTETRIVPTVTTEAPILTPLVPEPPELNSTVLAAQTCGRLADEPTSSGVWDAAAALEVGPLALQVDAAWAAVSTFVALDCPVHNDLVAETIAEVTG